jgi:hypothetical protein
MYADRHDVTHRRIGLCILYSTIPAAVIVIRSASPSDGALNSTGFGHGKLQKIRRKMQTAMTYNFYKPCKDGGASLADWKNTPWAKIRVAQLCWMASI